MSRNKLPQPSLPFRMSINQFTLVLFATVILGCATAVGLAFVFGWIK